MYRISRLLVFAAFLLFIGFASEAAASCWPVYWDVTLNGVAAADMTVSLSSSTTVASVPATVVVPAGSSSASFTVNTSPVSRNTSVTVSDTYNGVTKKASLFVRKK
jgi:hypothetical protein